MFVENPFESGHIKNYILLYASVVVIMVLFFIASTLFHDVESVEKKVFASQKTPQSEVQKEKEEVQKVEKRFKLLKQAY